MGGDEKDDIRDTPPPLVGGNSGTLVCSVCEQVSKGSEQLSYKSSEQLSFKSSEQLSFKSSEQVTYKSSEQLSYKSSEQLPYKSSEQLSYKSSEQLSFKSSEQLTYHLLTHSVMELARALVIMQVLYLMAIPQRDC